MPISLSPVKTYRSPLIRKNSPVARSPYSEFGNRAVRSVAIVQDDPWNMFAFGAMTFAFFMVILDQQIVASSLGEIQAGLAASPDELSGIQTWYVVAEILMIPICGWLSRVFSTHVFFSSCAFGFTIASILCGMAWNIESMILFRILQGFFGGALIPGVYSAIYKIFSEKYQSIVVVCVALVVTMAPTLGPTLGGKLTQSVGWQWLFYINIVPGVLITFIVARYLRLDASNLDLLNRFDHLGILLIFLFLGTSVYALEHGAQKNWFESNLITGLIIGSVIAGILMFYRELTIPNPVIDLRVFKDLSFSVGSLVAFGFNLAIMGSVYLIPVFCYRILSYNSQDIGEVMGLRGLSQLAMAPLLGILMKKIDLRLLCCLGIGLIGMSLYNFAYLTAQSGFVDFIWVQVPVGAGILFCAVSMNVIALGQMPEEKLNNASSMYSVSGILGASYGIALMNTMLVSRTEFHYRNLYQFIDESRTVAAGYLEGLTDYFGRRLPNIEDAETLAAKSLSLITQRESLVGAISDATLVSLVVILIPILFLPFIPKPVIREGGAGGH